jgi:hypothetical protein
MQSKTLLGEVRARTVDVVVMDVGGGASLEVVMTTTYSFCGLRPDPNSSQSITRVCYSNEN